jgi:tetratricopeptide (TPR) repeat protein
MVENNFKAGLDYYGKNDLSKALESWKKVISIDPDNEKAKFYIAEAEKQISEKFTKYYKTGIDFYNAGEYLKAMENWETALRFDKNNKEINEYMIKALVSQGIFLYRQEKLKEAISFWDKALKIRPNEEKILLYVKRAVNKIKNLEQ